jgi:hypothetical protein
MLLRLAPTTDPARQLPLHIRGRHMNQNLNQTSPAMIYVAWAIVVLPLLWGVYQTFIKVVDLFG